MKMGVGLRGLARLRRRAGTLKERCLRQYMGNKSCRERKR